MSNGWTLAVLLCSGWTGLNLLLIAFLYRLDGDDHDEDDDNDDNMESEMCASQATKHLVLFPLPPSRLQMPPGFNRFHPNSSNSCYKCHQVSKLFTQSHLPAGSPCPRKTWHSNDAEFILKAFFTFVFFLVRFMQKAWLIEVVGGGSRTEDFPYSAGWVICIIFIINYNYFDHNHGKKKKMTIMIMLFIVIISDIRWRRWSPSSRSSSPWWSLSSPQWSLWWDDEDHHENHDKMTRMGLKWSWLSL